MFGMRHERERQRHEGRSQRFQEHCGGGRRFGGREGGRGFGRRHGRGADGDEMGRAGRMLAQGDIRLIALALIAEQPRHGYEIIKVLEEKTSGWYSPSPGMVYPTLTFLEEAGYVTAQTEGAKKLYSITDEGRAYLEENKAFVDSVMARFAMIGARVAQQRERKQEDARGEANIPRSVSGAFMDLREAVREALNARSENTGRVIDIIARAVQELKKQ